MTSQNSSPPDNSQASSVADRTKAFMERLDHDLRTPLGTMAAAVELLRHEPMGTAMHTESLAVLQRQIGRLHTLTETLHEFSQTVGR